MIEVEWTVLFARLFSQADADTRAHISAHLRGLMAEGKTHKQAVQTVVRRHWNDECGAPLREIEKMYDEVKR